LSTYVEGTVPQAGVADVADVAGAVGLSLGSVVRDLSRYVRMKKMGLSEAAILKKLAADGLDLTEQERQQIFGVPSIAEGSITAIVMDSARGSVAESVPAAASGWQ